MHQAAYKGNKLCVARLLLAKGDLWDTPNKFGNPPANKARMAGYDIIAEALEQWGAGDRDGALAALGWTDDAPSLTPVEKAPEDGSTDASASASGATATAASPSSSSARVIVEDLYLAISGGNEAEALALVHRAQGKHEALNYIVTTFAGSRPPP